MLSLLLHLLEHFVSAITAAQCTELLTECKILVLATGLALLTTAGFICKLSLLHLPCKRKTCSSVAGNHETVNTVPSGIKLSPLSQAFWYLSNNGPQEES